jgi:hypothetical protein
MSQAKPSDRAIKQAVKEALAETLQEQRAMLHQVFAEVLEEFALSESIREGRNTPTVSRDTVIRVLRNKR